MNSKVSSVRSIVVAAALLVAGVSGVARADSDMNPLVGDSYAYFNGCNLGQSCTRVYDKAPSTFRVTNPNGLSERVLQSYSVWGEEFHLNKPVVDNARSEFALSRPHGLSESQLQALSTEGAHWQLPTQATTSALASTNEAAFSISAAK
jgi:hypothetical protein